MPNFETIQDSLNSLVDDRQDYWQLASIALCIIGAFACSVILNKTLFTKKSKANIFLARFFNTGKKISAIPALACLFLWITWSVRTDWSARLVDAGHSIIPSNFIYTAALLTTAFVIYQMTTALSKGRVMPKMISCGMMVLITLHVFGWLTPLSTALSGIKLPLGSIEINIWSIIAAVTALFVLLWLVGLSTRFVDLIIKPRKDIPPSIKVLIGKAARIILYVGAFLWALKIGGVPLGGLAVFSGALGLGLGFGLQKVISNLVSGVIILLDKSIKPRDVIEIDGTYGWINSIRTRYISVITRDRKEILIPNEDFVTNKVVNWSFSDKIVRIKADVGVSYSTDVPAAIEICKNAIKDIPRVLKDPEPNCLLMGFGDSAIDLQIRFWINDAPEGVSNIRSAVLLAVWKAFKEHDIEIPFPQRDINIKTDELAALKDR